MRTNVPLATRTLRARHGLRQVDLAARARLARDSVSRVETGRLGGMTIASLDRLVAALDATLVVEVRWRGADLDRLVDRAHAHLANAAAQRVERAGWIARAEVSFNHYGDRGSCDLLALHSASRTLLVVEVKSRIGNVQEMLHRLDVKARLANVLARQLDWPVPSSVVRALVLPDDRTARRTLAAHPALFAPFALRGRASIGWLRAPHSDVAGVLWFEKPADSDVAGTIRVRRVRRSATAG
jgi:transcriptional regulator with XRE-family HTH domain